MCRETLGCPCCCCGFIFGLDSVAIAYLLVTDIAAIHLLLRTIWVGK
jgi:hypothetical protein